METTTVEDCKLINLINYNDERGCFTELFHENKYLESSNQFYQAWRQINFSSSKKNVVRGLHLAPYAKLVSCVKGRIFDVVVDLRRGSKTYLKHYSVILDNTKQVYVPANCAHGFMALEDENIVVYSQTGVFLPNAGLEKDIFWKDPEFNIDWPIADKYILSEKDKNAPTLARIL